MKVYVLTDGDNSFVNVFSSIEKVENFFKEIYLTDCVEILESFVKVDGDLIFFHCREIEVK